ncbi:hypothetical protein WMY93_026488 [Mugilogobius chulae]|uniref:Uncharacterized protein n=1 Tax=Mugilogobius chulae TaxID=88201 RepID=A0AAW0N4F0_9GOBI
MCACIWPGIYMRVDSVCWEQSSEKDRGAVGERQQRPGPSQLQRQQRRERQIGRDREGSENEGRRREMRMRELWKGLEADTQMSEMERMQCNGPIERYVGVQVPCCLPLRANRKKGGSRQCLLWAFTSWGHDPSQGPETSLCCQPAPIGTESNVYSFKRHHPVLEETPRLQDLEEL